MAYCCVSTGLQVKAALVNEIARMFLKTAHLDNETSADIVTFMSTDVSKVFDGMQEFHYLWTAPLEAGAIIVILLCLLQQNALPGVGAIFLVMPLQYFFGYLITTLKKENSKYVNERSSIMQEVLPAIKLVKYYCWEQFFIDKVSAVSSHYILQPMTRSLWLSRLGPRRLCSVWLLAAELVANLLCCLLKYVHGCSGSGEGDTSGLEGPVSEDLLCGYGLLHSSSGGVFDFHYLLLYQWPLEGQNVLHCSFPVQHPAFSPCGAAQGYSRCIW